MTHLKSILILLSLTTIFVTSACTSKGGSKTPDDSNTAVQGNAATQETISGQDISTEDSTVASTSSSANTIDEGGKNVIYFEFNSSDLSDAAKRIVDRQAQYLMNNPDIAVVLEGHADERGTREYNMALGEKRAHSIKQLLELKGVSKQQVKTVSYGEERPEQDGHSEQFWSKNRRAVFSFASN
ncbi:MAG: peptidoglycan-associated lipoprotein Pal [Gammaproteobacteria bacterium]|nr:peptidoglycan-associated lipoprotein Pal [Gammaproteobacteria bacterium]